VECLKPTSMTRASWRFLSLMSPTTNQRFPLKNLSLSHSHSHSQLSRRHLLQRVFRRSSTSMILTSASPRALPRRSRQQTSDGPWLRMLKNPKWLKPCLALRSFPLHQALGGVKVRYRISLPLRLQSSTPRSKLPPQSSKITRS